MFARIVLIEDQAQYLKHVSDVCDKIPGCHVIGTAQDGLSGCELVIRMQPDIVLLDLNLPGMNGFAVMEKVRLTLPWIRFIVLSVHIDTVTLQRVEKARVSGYIDKGRIKVKYLQQALETVMAGRAYYSQRYHEAVKRRQNDPRSFDKLLTPREQSVLRLIGSKYSDEEVADQLGMAVSTVETHRKRLMRKLEQANRAQLIKYAVDCGFTQF